MVTVEKPEYKVIGTRPLRHDGVNKVNGRAKYGADQKLSGLIHAAKLRSPHVHAKINHVDTSKAEALPGVRGVGEMPICPPPAAIANAIYGAVGVRMRKLPLSPPRLLAKILNNGSS